MDSTDARILLALDDAPESTVLGLSKALGMSRNTVHARLHRLTRDHLREPSQRVDPASLGHPLAAFVSLVIRQEASDSVTAHLESIPQVIEAHAVSGDSDLLIKVVAEDTTDLHRLVTRILRVDGIERASTSISLSTVMSNRVRALLEATARPA